MLRAPLTSKEVEDGENSALAFGVASMQGWRLRMEDAHLALPDFDASRSLGLFGVFDGHGGAAVAKVVSERLPAVLRENAHFKAGRYQEALYESFFKMDEVLDSASCRKEIVQRASKCPASSDEDEDDDDEDLLLEGEEEEEGEEDALMMMEESEEEEEEGEMALDGIDEDGVEDSNAIWINGEGPDCMGTTAVVALVRGGENPEVFVANAGDSRCVLVAGQKGVDLSEDHKPTLPNERKRIRKAGGFVANEEDGGRVDGNLSLSRALADFAYKKNRRLKPSEQKISCEPEVRRKALGADDDFLLLGCDGIWEKASSQQVASFMLPRVSSHGSGSGSGGAPLSTACAAFLDKNLAKTPMADMGLGCDNMTLMVVDVRGAASATPSVENGAAAVPVRRGSRQSFLMERRHRCSRTTRRRRILRLRHVAKRRRAAS